MSLRVPLPFPSPASNRLEREGAINVLESYHFKKKSEHNPCQRKPPGRTFPCNNWGYAIAEYSSGEWSKAALSA